MNNSKKRVLGDATLRIISSLVTTIVNKVILLPVLASLLSEAAYGNALTVIGVESILSLAFSNSLYSVRLIMNEKYEREKCAGDFKLLLLIGIVISVFIFTVVCCYTDLFDRSYYVFLLVPYVILAMSNMYFSVWYPIKIKYKSFLYQSLTTAAGTLIGLVFVKITGIWPIAYLLSAVFGFAFIYFNTGIIKEPYSRTKLFGTSTIKWIILIITTALANGMTYLDRFILHPIIGAASVAIYTTASYFGKSISIIITPISNVMLGYFANDKFNMTKKKLWGIIVFSIAILVLFSFVILVMGNIITGMLFPKIVESAKPYIFIANLASAIAAVTQMVQAVTLKYAETKWQIIIQAIYAAVYILLAIILVRKYGIFGLCYSVLFANGLKFIILILISMFSLGRKDPHNNPEVIKND